MSWTRTTKRAIGASTRLIVAPSTRTSSAKIDTTRIGGRSAGRAATATTAAMATVAARAAVGLNDAAAEMTTAPVIPAAAHTGRHGPSGNIRAGRATLDSELKALTGRKS